MSIRRSVLFTRIVKTIHNSRNHLHHPQIAIYPPKHNLTFLSAKRFTHKSVKCWQCGIQREHVGDLFCQQCQFIQKPTHKNNYFKVFDLQESFDIDQKQLTNKFRQMQSQLHPDKFTMKSNQEKNISEEFSSLVNEAYKNLQHPLTRAIHLLHLRGEELEEGQKVNDPEFLMEIMELNEEVESADSEAALSKLEQKNDERLVKVGKEIKQCFDDNQIDKAKEAIIKMKYYNSIDLHINKLMRD